MDRRDAVFGQIYRFKLRHSTNATRIPPTVTGVLTRTERDHNQHIVYVFVGLKGEEYRRKTLLGVYPCDSLDVESVSPIPPLPPIPITASPDKLANELVDEQWTAVIKAEIERLQKLQGGTQ